MSSPSQGSGQATHSREKKNQTSNMKRKDDLVGFRAESITSGGDFTEEERGAVELKDPG